MHAVNAFPFSEMMFLGFCFSKENTVSEINYSTVKKKDEKLLIVTYEIRTSDRKPNNYHPYRGGLCPEVEVDMIKVIMKKL